MAGGGAAILVPPSLPPKDVSLLAARGPTRRWAPFRRRRCCLVRAESSGGGAAGNGGGSPSNQPSMSEQRQRWAASVRSRTGRQKHTAWEPEMLEPPALLADITVVMVRTKLPRTVGTVARTCSCFECEDIRMVAPDCDHLQRVSRNSSCGAQYLLHRMKICTDLDEALADCDFTVAFSRWLPGHNSARSIADLIEALPPRALSGRSPRIALVFGREDSGLTEEEISHCDMVCSIPIGRLQESLSVSHAVTIPLAKIFEDRVLQLGDNARPWLVT